jgi:hypothetical protein
MGEFMDRTMTSMSVDQDLKKIVAPTRIPPTQTLPQMPVSYCSRTCQSESCEQCFNADQWWSHFKESTNEIVYLSNVHKCHKGCITKSHPTCKSRFPREIYAHTTVDSDTGALNLKKGEAWLNYFTPTVTYILRCNTDVTSLQSGTAIKAVIAYVTDYITKSPLKTHVMFDAVKTVFNRQAEALNNVEQSKFDHTQSVITKIVNALTSQSEIGSPMAAMYLLKHPDHYTSLKFERFYWKLYVYEVCDAFKNSDELEEINHNSNIDTSNTSESKMAIGKNIHGIVGFSPIHDYIYCPIKY